MPDIIDVLKKECGDLYQKGVTIVRTPNGKFEHMPWEKAYHEMERVSSFFVPYSWSFGIPSDAILWRDKGGKVYASTNLSKIPSDHPRSSGPGKPITFKPIYFEELSPKQAKELTKKAFSKEARYKLALRTND